MIRKKLETLFDLFLDILSIVKAAPIKGRLPLNESAKTTICILGTGPTLNKSFSKYHDKNEIVNCMGVNDFAMSELYTIVKPAYYIWMDPARWLPKDAISEDDYRRRELTNNKIIENTNWDMVIILPYSIYKSGTLNYLSEKNKHITFLPINTVNTSLTNSSITFFSLKHNFGASFNNVMAWAIYASINLGFKEVNLFGAEHSWTKDIRVNENNEVCIVKRHFFDKSETLIPWKKTDSNSTFGMSEILYILGDTFKSYELLRLYSEKHFVIINNYTDGSFIDAFARKTI